MINTLFRGINSCVIRLMSIVPCQVFTITDTDLEACTPKLVCFAMLKSNVQRKKDHDNYFCRCFDRLVRMYYVTYS